MGNWNYLGFVDAPEQREKGAKLFKQGDPIEYMYVLKSGRLRLIRHTPEGDTSLLHIAGCGEMIAEASLFSPLYHCTAVFDIHSEVLKTDRDTLIRELTSNADSGLRLLSLFSQQIRELRGLLEIRNIRSARDRILAYLNSLADAKGHVIIDSSRRDIAYRLGLAPETLYRELRALSDGDIIQQVDEKTLLILS